MMIPKNSVTNDFFLKKKVSKEYLSPMWWSSGYNNFKKYFLKMSPQNISFGKYKIVCVYLFVFQKRALT